MGETCGTCRHWVMDSIDANNLAAPRNGECREGPPVPIGIPTPAGLQLMVIYPKVPPQFPACGRYVAAVIAGGLCPTD